PAYQLSEEEHLFTEKGRALYRMTLQRIRQGGTHRSDASFLFRHQQTLLDSHAEFKDLATIRSWYDHTRHRAIAIQHGCTAFAHTFDATATPVGPLQRRVRRIVEGEGAVKS